MAKFTQEQIDQAKAEFLSENVPSSVLPGAGNNGQIIVYKKDENGPSQAASE